MGLHEADPWDSWSVVTMAFPTDDYWAGPTAHKSADMKGAQKVLKVADWWVDRMDMPLAVRWVEKSGISMADKLDH